MFFLEFIDFLLRQFNQLFCIFGNDAVLDEIVVLNIQGHQNDKGKATECHVLKLEVEET
jgi:hypothetical protein